MRAEGVVDAIGAGMNQAAMLARFVTDTDVDAVLCAGRYTLLEQPALGDLLPAAEARGKSVVIGGVFNSGLLGALSRPGGHRADRGRRAGVRRHLCGWRRIPRIASSVSEARSPQGGPTRGGVRR
jgi:aryl-alcohol dehydrogenase-like predicted oxidoreductase